MAAARARANGRAGAHATKDHSMLLQRVAAPQMKRGAHWQFATHLQPGVHDCGGGGAGGVEGLEVGREQQPAQLKLIWATFTTAAPSSPVTASRRSAAVLGGGCHGSNSKYSGASTHLQVAGSPGSTQLQPPVQQGVAPFCAAAQGWGGRGGFPTCVRGGAGWDRVG